MSQTLGFTPVDIDWDALAKQNDEIFKQAYAHLRAKRIDSSEIDFVKAVDDVVQAMGSNVRNVSQEQKDTVLAAIRSRGYISFADGFVSNLGEGSIGALSDRIKQGSPNFSVSDVANLMMAQILRSGDPASCEAVSYHFRALCDEKYAFDKKQAAAEKKASASPHTPKP